MCLVVTRSAVTWQISGNFPRGINKDVLYLYCIVTFIPLVHFCLDLADRGGIAEKYLTCTPL